MVAAGGEEAFQEGGTVGAREQLRAGQGAFGGVGVQVEGDTLVGGAVEGGVAVQEAWRTVLAVRQQGAQGAGVGRRVQLAGVPQHPGQQQDGLRARDPYARGE